MDVLKRFIFFKSKQNSFFKRYKVCASILASMFLSFVRISKKSVRGRYRIKILELRKLKPGAKPKASTIGVLFNDKLISVAE